MKYYVLPDENAIGQAVGNLFCDLVRQKANAVLGLATGASPLPVYARMISQCEAGEVSFRDVRTFNLDEYCDLPQAHKNSYRTYMRQELFDKIDINSQNTHFLDGNCSDEFAESERFRQYVKAAGGIDLQLLGIGRNGHIGFNEPSENFTQEPFKVALTPSTIAANSIYFDDIPMPKYAMTMGVGMILRAKQIVLIATGSAKADAVKAMLEGEITPRCPASALRQHPHVVAYFDPSAAALLRK
ncbi:MAG: glucosamine-6-phosphate deaminase [Oscillospiraceae bacterium]|jgi:glucosamine-6-phosphate deaminase|nr:glucosamine-6-phosphate deaminase [Oscillospiraceae bacterium]